MNAQGSIKKLFNLTLVYFLANFSTRILSFLLLPLYTSHLSPSDYGSVDLVFTFAQFFTPVITLNLANATFRFLIDAENHEEKQQLISSSFFIIATNSIIVIFLSSVLYIFSHNIYLFLGGIYIITTSFSSYILQCYRGVKRNTTYAVMGVINSFLHIIFNIIFIVGLSIRSLSLILSPIIASSITFAILILYRKFYKYIHFKSVKKTIIKSLLKFSLPTVPETLIWWFLTGFAKTYLSYAHGSNMLGIYSVATKFSDLLIALYSIFNLAWAEFAYASYKEKNKDAIYSIAFNTLAKVMLSCIMILIPLTKICVTWLLDDSYLSGMIYMPVLYIMAFINILSTYYGTGFQSAKKTNGIFISSIIGVAVNVPLCLVLIPRFNIWGIVVALFLANIALLISKKYLSKKFFKIQIDPKWLLLFIPTSLSIVAFYLENNIINIIWLMICIIIALISNIDLLKTFFSAIFKRGVKNE